MRSSRRKPNALLAVRLFCFLTGMVFNRSRRSFYLFLTICLLLVVWGESAKIWRVKWGESAKITRFQVGRKRVENPLKSQRSVESAENAALRFPEAVPQLGR